MIFSIAVSGGHEMSNTGGIKVNCHMKTDRFLFRKGWFRFIVMACFLGTGVLGCTCSKVILPEVSKEATSTRHVGKFIWFDLFTRDLPGACNFYERLFGWSFEDTTQGNSNLKTIRYDGIPIGNAAQIKPHMDKMTESRWFSFMSVADVDKTVEWITKNGGTVHIPPKDMPHRGRLALVHDPQGAPFAVLTASKGDPPDHSFVPNVWIGSELWTHDVKGALAFYGNIAGYQPETRKAGADSTYLLLFKDGQPRGGLVKIPWKDVKPNWVPYIGVRDIESIVLKAEKLGGKVLVGLDPDREDDVAILADPSGAVFGVLQLGDDINRGGNPS
jgi:uncharacterized protein